MTQEEIVLYFVMPAVGFVLGSIPFAFVIGKINGVDIRTTGSKNVGATNLGRTMGQLKGGHAGKTYFFGAFLLDAAKGFVPTLIAVLIAQRGYFQELDATLQPIKEDQLFNQLFGPQTLHGVFAIRHVAFPSWVPLLTAIAAVLGHLFPPWLKFKGGKGVATTFGVVLGLWPLYTLSGIAAGLFFIVMLMIYRYISLASITASLLFVALVAFLGMQKIGPVDFRQPWDQLWPLLAVAGLFSAMIIYRHRTNIGRLIKGTEPHVGQKEIDKSKL